LPTGNWSEERSREISQNSFGTTYIGSVVALEDAVVDLHDDTHAVKAVSINSSTLEVACPPPRIAAKI
jgi:hypothetical protein